MTEQKLWLIIL